MFAHSIGTRPRRLLRCRPHRDNVAGCAELSRKSLHHRGSGLGIDPSFFWRLATLSLTGWAIHLSPQRRESRSALVGVPGVPWARPPRPGRGPTIQIARVASDNCGDRDAGRSLVAHEAGNQVAISAQPFGPAPCAGKHPPKSGASSTRHCSRNFDAVFLHNHRVANVDRLVVPLCVLGAEADAAVADILKPE
jgi:hypothetical protein